MLNRFMVSRIGCDGFTLSQTGPDGTQIFSATPGGPAVNFPGRLAPKP
jgi:hypothetical protein